MPDTCIKIIVNYIFTVYKKGQKYTKDKKLYNKKIATKKANPRLGERKTHSLRTSTTSLGCLSIFVEIVLKCRQKVDRKK